MNALKKIVFASLFVSFILMACTKISTEQPAEQAELSSTVSVQALEEYQSYGLVGDGVTDNTVAMQSLFNNSSVIYLKAGSYIINQTINLKSGVKLYGQAGTIIKAGPNMTGSLLTNGRYFFVNAADQVVINQITFNPSDKAFSLSNWNNACIYLLNSKSALIANNTFNFKLPYGTLGMEAVWVSGAAAMNNKIYKNKLLTLGIKYAENGANGTIVERNVLNNAYSNALTANGNHVSAYSAGCQVLYNTITNAGRMGIEDWGNIDGTLIKGNVITGTGMDTKQAIDGIALSAVGTNVTVTENTIKLSKLYAIEVRGNYGVSVTKNSIINNPLSTAIILNYTFPVPAKAVAGRVANIVGNTITNSAIGVHIFGDHQAASLIASNQFGNVINKGISIESGAKVYQLDIKKNKFSYTIKTAKDRYGVFSYTKYSPGSANQIINLVADTLNYTAAAGAGAGIDFGVVIRTDKAVLDNLTITGSNNKSSGGVPVNGITAFGAKPIGVKLTNNKVTGAIVDFTGFQNKIASGNNF
jgi:hypothetical protein